MGEYKVVVTARSFGEGNNEPFRILEEAGCEVFKNKSEKPLTSDELIPIVEDADALIAGNDIIDAKVIISAKKLKVISRYGVGYDNVDLKAAKERGIIVTNTPNANDNSVADLTFALILSLARNIPVVSNTVKEGGWSRIIGTEIWGKTMGIIGSGRIGKEVAQRAKGFNMNILCFDKYPDYKFAKECGIKYCEFDELLKSSDFISIHVPLMPETKHLFNSKTLAMMKPGAFLVNTARGSIIDEIALYEVLKEKRISGAALDVMEKEPPKGSPLLELDNIIITPHIGGYTFDAVRNMGVTAARNVALVLNNKPGAFIINL